MSRSIQAYFPTENEAEAVKTLLQTYETQTLEVSALDGGNGYGADGVPLIVPFAASNMTGTSGTGMFNGVGAVNDYDKSIDNMRYVLSAKVKDEDYETIVDVIHDNKGKILQ
ncbi:MAG TPA: hypothetical protein VGE40_13505 [Bacilli bacterium]